METEAAEQAASALMRWKRRREALDAQRDNLILAALDAGLNKEAVHQFSGVGRSTIDRILAKRGGR